MYGLVLIYTNADVSSCDPVGSMICPVCGEEIGITGDQLRGEVSVVCDSSEPRCGFHPTFRENRELTPFRYVVRWG